MRFLLCDLSLIDRPQLITDRFVSYEDGNDHWGEPEVHYPISWHSYPAAMNGRFVSAGVDGWQEHVKWADVIMFTFTYNLKLARQVIEKARSIGKKTICAMHEGGAVWQMNARSDIEWVADLRDVYDAADYAFVHIKPGIYVPVLKGLGVTSKVVTDIPQAAPFKRRMYFSDEKSGIFIGSRFKDFELEKRNFWYSVSCAINEIKAGGIAPRIVVQNASDKFTSGAFKDLLMRLNPEIAYEVHGNLPYDDFLHLIASCEWTMNLDSADIQGQVEFDSLFVGTDIVDWVNPQYRSDIMDKYAWHLKTGNYAIGRRADVPYKERRRIIEVFMANHSFEACRDKITEQFELK